jgi:hypothetical protein
VRRAGGAYLAHAPLSRFEERINAMRTFAAQLTDTRRAAAGLAALTLRATRRCAIGSCLMEKS